MSTLFAVAAGGAAGAAARFLVGTIAGGPWGTFAVNVIGSFILGLFAGLMALSWNPAPEFRAFLTVGLLGGFTTFSAFSLDVVLLAERGRLELAAAYLASTVICSVGGLAGGLRLARAFLA